MEAVEPVLKNIYQSNIYRKDLGWPHLNDAARVQEKLQKYCKDLLFWVVWAFLIMATKNDSICFKETLFLIFMQKVKFMSELFFPRFCNFVTLSTLGMSGYPHQNNNIFLWRILMSITLLS